MFDRNRNKFMNNGGMPQLGNRRQGYGLQQLNQPQPNQNAYDNASPNASFNRQPQFQGTGGVETMQPSYTTGNWTGDQQPQQTFQQTAPINTQMGAVNPQYGSQPAMQTNSARDRYMNDDMRRRLQQMMLRRRMGRSGRFGMSNMGRGY